MVSGHIAQDPGLPLWHKYLLLGMTVALNKTDHPQHAFMKTFHAMLEVMSRVERDYMSERTLENQSNLTTLWHATGPCGVGSYSSAKSEKDFRQIMVTVNKIFYINMTVLWQKMTFMQRNCSTSYVEIISGDFGDRHRKCGTGGKYFHLVKHYVAYISISYYEMKDNVSLAFVYQVINAEATDNAYTLPKFIFLHLSHTTTLLAAEALQYQGRQYLLWTFNTFHFLYVVEVRIFYNCLQSLAESSGVLLEIWDGDETGFITGSGIEADLSVLHSVDLCNIEQAPFDNNGEIVASGSTGGITIGLEYALSALFFLRMQIAVQMFICTPDKCNEMHISINSRSTPSFFYALLEKGSRVYIHSFVSSELGLFPILNINNLTYERIIPVNTSTCGLGSIHLYIPQQDVSMTFCSATQIQFLKKMKVFGGIYFGNQVVFLIIKNHGRFGKVHLEYTLNLSPCVGINKLCQLISHRISEPYGEVLFNGYSLFIENEACAILQTIPSDGANANNCTLIVMPMNPFYRNNLTIQLLETREDDVMHPACLSSVTVSVDMWKSMEKDNIILYSPGDYQNRDLWHKLSLFHKCPALGTYIQIMIRAVPIGCDEKRTINEVLPYNELILYCGLTAVTGVKTSSNNWVFVLTRTSYATNFRDRCCRTSVNIYPIAVNCSLVDMIDVVVFREVFLVNDSLVNSYSVRYIYSPRNNVSFDFTVQGSQETQYIMIFPQITGSTMCSIDSQKFGFIIKHHQVHFETHVSPFLLAPVLSFGEYYTVVNKSTETWWHGCTEFQCYWYEADIGSVTWNQAEAMCESRGGHILSLNTENELEGLRDWAGFGISPNFSRYNTRNIYYRAEIFKKNILFLGLRLSQKVFSIINNCIISPDILEQLLTVNIKGTVVERLKSDIKILYTVREEK